MGEWLARTTQRFGERLPLILALVFLVQLPFHGIFVLAAYLAPEGGSQYLRLGNWGGMAVGSAVSAVLLAALDRPEATLGGALRAGLPRWIPLLIVQFLATLGVLMGLVLLVVPGVVLFLHFAIAAPLVVLGGRSGVFALNKSSELVRGHRLKILGLYLSLAVVALPCVLAPDLLVLVGVPPLVPDLMGLGTLLLFLKFGEVAQYELYRHLCPRLQVP